MPITSLFMDWFECFLHQIVQKIQGYKMRKFSREPQFSRKILGVKNAKIQMMRKFLYLEYIISAQRMYFLNVMPKYPRNL